MMRLLENPWLSLPALAPFILKHDQELVENFNATAPDEFKYHLEIWPEPFIGRVDASVVLLNLNPGFSIEEYRYHHLDKYFRQAMEANFRQEPQAFPFYFLDPSIDSPGHLWWKKRLRILAEKVGLTNLAQNLLCVEFFPYHSIGFSDKTPRVPSQAYSFQLVHSAIQRNAVIIVMRAKSKWLEAVPKLATSQLFRLNSSQSIYVTPSNCPRGFGAAERAILEAVG